MLPNSSHKASIPLIPTSDKSYLTHIHTHTQSQVSITDENKHKILNKILANQIQQYIKKIICHDQVVLSPGMGRQFNIHQSNNKLH